jgi:KaiC/GvpD/RAD55 family RecA-like ATPase
MKRVSVGVRALNQILVGGLPKGSVTLVLGPPGSGKSVFSKRFLMEGIRVKDPSVLISTSETYDTVMETILSFGWDKELFKSIIFVDCYSWRIGGSNIKYKASLSSPNEVSIVIGEVIEKELKNSNNNPRLVFDSFTDVIKYVGPESALKLMDAIRLKLHSNKITSLILLEEGVHDARTVAALEYSTDGTIKMNYSEKGRYMMVSRMIATPITLRWIPFTIG